MKLIIGLLICFMVSCHQDTYITISLIDNPCLIKIKNVEYESLSDSIYEKTQNENIKLSVKNGSDNMSKILSLTNQSNDTIFFDNSNSTRYESLCALPLVSNDSSLWVNFEDSKTKEFHKCLLANKYIIYASEFQSKNLLLIELFSGGMIKPNSDMNLEIKFKDEGTYKVSIAYFISNPKLKIGRWGLSQARVSSQMFYVKKTD